MNWAGYQRLLARRRFGARLALALGLGLIGFPLFVVLFLQQAEWDGSRSYAQWILPSAVAFGVGVLTVRRAFFILPHFEENSCRHCMAQLQGDEPSITQSGRCPKCEATLFPAETPIVEP